MAAEPLLGNTLNTHLSTAGEWLLSSGLRIVLVAAIMYVALRAARIVALRLFTLFAGNDDIEMKKRADTLSSVVRVGLTIAIMAVGLVSILGELGVQIGPVLAAAGVVGLAVGFGAQQLVQDVISGFFILLEDQIRVGDVVQIAGKSGLVERVTLRTVVLRDTAGSVHYVRNGQIDTVTNMTKDFSYYAMDIGVGYREDVDQVMEVIREVAAELCADQELGTDILEPIEIMGLDKFADSAVIIKARLKTKPIRQWAVGREFNRRLKKRFDAEGIEIPYPHVTMYMGQDRQGNAPSLHMKIKKEDEKA
ncbi:mechanosensitive ion channel family protein [Desulfocurvibacter africanus]|uniref:MscS Mechanosensitive ion channel n=1 Tax=Desulfocurvibacter africanus subsp. africanus str. Walvis Bay TaxID=690850 RepID=F3Z1G0_DESAF|nr:mechanosensitive ion channel family protein [Desulfocurvibacter africanus]EGJ49991.1 MscS Mechanosensitive ion channel [Desulfocurvibacter africanus subsp. africanus str. Walvis Bay]